MMQAIAIDDEPIALEIIKTFAAGVPGINLVGCFNNAVAALQFMQQQEVHLIFLDIKMPGLSGIKFLQNLDTKPIVVMTTAYSEYAVQGFELEVSDYLLKPFKHERFLKACAKAVRQHEQANATTQAGEIFIKSGYERIRVQTNDILYIESVGNYMHFKLADKTVIGRYTLHEVQSILPAKTFIRVHRSFLVAIAHITKTDKKHVWAAGFPIVIGDAYRAGVENLVNPPSPLKGE